MKSIFLILLCYPLCYQQAKAQAVLDNYIREGLVNNETIKQQQFLLDKSVYALLEARSMFLPTIAFGTTYTLAGGGRTVDIPIGDLLNGAYKTLNQLTAGSSFPQVNNQHILLNPDNFYDARFRTTYPIINADLRLNKKIKEQQAELQRSDMEMYKRELVKDIKTAYYTYLKATAAIKIYAYAVTLVKENLRINTALFTNQKVNRTAVIRSDNEVVKIAALAETAIHEKDKAKAYLNFLLNRPLDDSIQTDEYISPPGLSLLADTSISTREELDKMNTAKAINNNLVHLANNYKKPTLNSFIDVGSQGFDFMVNKKSAYYFMGLSLQWNVFAGGKNKFKVRQAETDSKVTESETHHITEQLKLQLYIAQNDFKSALAQYHAAQSQQVSAQKYYHDVLRLYKEGTLLFIELLDAQNQLVSAQLQENISLYDTWIKQADIERANAGFTLEPPNRNK